jgi:hypothetical protein
VKFSRKILKAIKKMHLTLIGCDLKIYFSHRHTHKYAENKDFLPGRPALAKASNAFQA